MLVSRTCPVRICVQYPIRRCYNSRAQSMRSCGGVVRAEAKHTKAAPQLQWYGHVRGLNSSRIARSLSMSFSVVYICLQTAHTHWRSPRAMRIHYLYRYTERVLRVAHMFYVRYSPGRVFTVGERREFARSAHARARVRIPLILHVAHQIYIICPRAHFYSHHFSVSVYVSPITH